MHGGAGRISDIAHDVGLALARGEGGGQGCVNSTHGTSVLSSTPCGHGSYADGGLSRFGWPRSCRVLGVMPSGMTPAA